MVSSSRVRPPGVRLSPPLPNDVVKILGVVGCGHDHAGRDAAGRRREASDSASQQRHCASPARACEALGGVIGPGGVCVRAAGWLIADWRCAACVLDSERLDDPAQCAAMRFGTAASRPQAVHLKPSVPRGHQVGALVGIADREDFVAGGGADDYRIRADRHAPCRRGQKWRGTKRQRVAVVQRCQRECKRARRQEWALLIADARSMGATDAFERHVDPVPENGACRHVASRRRCYGPADSSQSSSRARLSART